MLPKIIITKEEYTPHQARRNILWRCHGVYYVNFYEFAEYVFARWRIDVVTEESATAAASDFRNRHGCRGFARIESGAKRFVQAKDSTEAHALARTVCMVTGMSLAMSLIGLMLAGTPLIELPLRFASVWPVNFCAAFWWQILVAGPIARMSLKILRSYRKDSELITEDL